MSRYNEKKLNYDVQEKLLNILCKILFKLETPGAIKKFLKDLLNRNERTMLVRRLFIAEMLLDKRTYNEIKNQLHCGKSTIARVERWLNFGRGGYREAIRVKKNQK